jgi:hypothetical protein
MPETEEEEDHAGNQGCRVDANKDGEWLLTSVVTMAMETITTMIAVANV